MSSVMSKVMSRVKGHVKYNIVTQLCRPVLYQRSQKISVIKYIHYYITARNTLVKCLWYKK